MIYQLRANLYFDDLDPIDDIVDKILDRWNETKVINPDSPNIEFCSYEVIANHHDEDPNSACQRIDQKDNKPPPPG